MPASLAALSPTFVARFIHLWRPWDSVSSPCSFHTPSGCLTMSSGSGFEIRKQRIYSKICLSIDPSWGWEQGLSMVSWATHKRGCHRLAVYYSTLPLLNFFLLLLIKLLFLTQFLFLCHYSMPIWNLYTILLLPPYHKLHVVIHTGWFCLSQM